MKISMGVQGSDTLGTVLSRVGKAQGLAEVLEAAAEDIGARAAVNLTDGKPPESRSGALAQSLTVTPGGDGQSFILSTPLDYGWYLEFGSLSRPATPWLAPALDAAMPSIKERLREWLKASLRDVRRS